MCCVEYYLKGQTEGFDSGLPLSSDRVDVIEFLGFLRFWCRVFPYVILAFLGNTHTLLGPY